MINLNINNLTSVEEIKRALLPLIDDIDFKWLKPIVNFTLDESVIIYLNKHEPVTNRFVTLDLKEHITEATNLINNNISKRNEIFELETRALSSAIEYVQLINSLKDDQKLGELNLKAAFNQSGIDIIDDYSEALQSKFENIGYILKTRFSLHNQDGNPLNYGERVKYLRKIYCDNIKNIYERLTAVKRTLKYSYKQDTLPLPNYIEVSNNLDKLVWWMRNTITKFETKEQYDYVIQKTITVSKGLAVSDTLAKIHNNIPIEVTVSADDFGINENFERMRILGLSVNVIGNYDGMPIVDFDAAADPASLLNAYIQHRQNQIAIHIGNRNIGREVTLYSCAVTPPEQNTFLDSDYLFEIVEEQEEEITYYLSEVSKKIKSTGFIDLNNVGDFKFDDNGNIKLFIKPSQARPNNIEFPTKLMIGELQPIYKTSINSNLDFIVENSIKNASPIGTWKLHIENVSFDQAIRDEKLKDLKDITLTFRLGIRKF